MTSDTSLDYQHKAFRDASGTVPFGSVNANMHNKVYGILNADASGYYAPNAAHGTLVASVNVGKDWYIYKGIAKAAGLIFVDLSPTGTEGVILPSGFFDTLSYLGSLLGVTSHGASWGATSGGGHYGDLSYAFDMLVWENRRFTQRVSGGNDGPYTACAQPATGKNVVSTGATLFDPRYQAYFSSTGLTVDGRRLPLVSSPGWNVPAARAVPFTTPGHETTAFASGTSLTSIDGVIILLKQRYLTLNPSSGGSTAALEIATLIAHGNATYFVTNNEQGTSLLEGVPLTSYGVSTINPLYMVDVTNEAQLEDEDSVWQRCYTRAGGGEEEVNVAVTWTDVPSMAYVYPTLINDYDVAVITDLEARWSEDGVNPHETLLHVRVGTFVRIAVFAFAGRLTEAADMYFAIHMRALASGLTAVACGSAACLPGQRFECAVPALGYERFCLADGSLTGCLQAENPSGGTEVGAVACTLPHATRSYLVGAGACQAAECDSYYALNATTSACECVPGVYVQCPGGGDLVFTQCNSTSRAYVTCPDPSKAGSSKYNPAFSVSDAGDGIHNYMRIPAVIVMIGGLLAYS